MVILHITSLAREIGVTFTHDVTGRQLPWVPGPTGELGDDSVHATEPHLPGLTMAAWKGWKLWEC